MAAEPTVAHLLSCGDCVLHKNLRNLRISSLQTLASLDHTENPWTREAGVGVGLVEKGLPSAVFEHHVESSRLTTSLLLCTESTDKLRQLTADNNRVRQLLVLSRI